MRFVADNALQPARVRAHAQHHWSFKDVRGKCTTGPEPGAEAVKERLLVIYQLTFLIYHLKKSSKFGHYLTSQMTNEKCQLIYDQ
jgi:hypothetical protein